MSPKKRNKRRTPPKVQPVSVGLNDTTSSPPAIEPLLTTQYVREIWRTHPLRPKTILLTFVVVSLIAFVLLLAAAKGYLTHFILQLAGENMAPRTAIVVGAACLLVLSGVIAFRGPFTTRTGWVYGIFGVSLPALALAAWGLICSISVGALGAALVVRATIAPYLWEVAFRLGLFAFGLIVFLSITVTTADAPRYSSQRFNVVIRRLAAAMFLVMTGWFIVGALFVAEQR